MSELIQDQEYKKWLSELKNNIKRSQIKAALTVNSQLILLYWNLGKQIVEKQENTLWGSGFIDQLSKDLKVEFPQMGGFSRTNLFAIRKFYLFHRDSFLTQTTDNQKLEFVPQLGGQIQEYSESFKLVFHSLIMKVNRNVVITQCNSV